MPVTARACQVIISCIPASRSFWPATRALLHIGRLTVPSQLDYFEPGGPALGQVRDSNIGVAPGVLQAVLSQAAPVA